MKAKIKPRRINVIDKTRFWTQVQLMWELTDDKAFFSPIIWADGDATESWSNICFSFSLSVEIVLKADFKVKYTTKIVKKNYRNDTICRSKCRTIQCITMKTKNTKQANKPKSCD